MLLVIGYQKVVLSLKVMERIIGNAFVLEQGGIIAVANRSHNL